MDAFREAYLTLAAIGMAAFIPVMAVLVIVLAVKHYRTTLAGRAKTDSPDVSSGR